MCYYIYISAGDMAGVACRGLVCVCVHVCAVGKMAKDIGMTIRNSILVSFLPCLVAFLAFHPYMFFHFFFMFFLLLVSVAFLGGRKPWIVVVAQLQLAATYIHDSHTVQMYNFSSKGPTDNCKAILAKMNIQHRKRGRY